MRLLHKSVVIVGGTGGLGLSAARACVREGACLVIVGRDQERCDQAVAELNDLANEFPSRASLQLVAAAVVGDAANQETSQRAIAMAVQAYGKLDGLYHVAGGSGRKLGDGPLHEISDEGWRATWELNASSLFFSNRAAVRQFLSQQTGGSVLNMSSVLASHASPHFFATHTYATTKAAAIGLTQTAAAFYAPHNIRFNAVAPSLVETPLAARACNDPTIMQYVHSKQPLDGGRIAQPSDLDEAVIYFLSDASRFVTGQVLQIDGGWSVTEGQYR